MNRYEIQSYIRQGIIYALTKLSSQRLILQDKKRMSRLGTLTYVNFTQDK